MTFTCECVACKHRATFVDLRDLPTCPKCYSVMVVLVAETKP